MYLYINDTYSLTIRVGPSLSLLIKDESQSAAAAVPKLFPPFRYPFQFTLLFVQSLNVATRVLLERTEQRKLNAMFYFHGSVLASPISPHPSEINFTQAQEKCVEHESVYKALLNGLSTAELRPRPQRSHLPVAIRNASSRSPVAATCNRGALRSRIFAVAGQSITDRRGQRTTDTHTAQKWNPRGV